MQKPSRGRVVLYHLSSQDPGQMAMVAHVYDDSFPDTGPVANLSVCSPVTAEWTPELMVTYSEDRSAGRRWSWPPRV